MSSTEAFEALKVDSVYPWVIYIAADFFLGIVKQQPGNSDAEARYAFLLECLNTTEETIPGARNYLMQLELENQDVPIVDSFPFAIKKGDSEATFTEGRMWG